MNLPPTTNLNSFKSNCLPWFVEASTLILRIKRCRQFQYIAFLLARVTVPKDSIIKIVNNHGKQVVDFWAVSFADPRECLSMAHTHGALCKLIPSVGDVLYSDFSKPMMILTEDTTPGIHDTLVSPCDAGRYKLLGVEDYHPSCTDNYISQSKLLAKEHAIQVPTTPLNLFMNVQVSDDGKLTFGAPTSEAGQYVCLKMLMNAIVVMSACPMDLRATNNYNPTECHYIMLDS